MIKSGNAKQWNEVESVLRKMPLYLKESRQAGKKGKPIFDPVGTNQHLKKALSLPPNSWKNIEIPKDLKFLGTDVDYGSKGMLVEVQFSNYPFLLNNTIRSELFFSTRCGDGRSCTDNYSACFLSNNSYEQAVSQLKGMDRFSLFHVPIRLVGLFETTDRAITATWTDYKSSSSRTVLAQQRRVATLCSGKHADDRCLLKFSNEQ